MLQKDVFVDLEAKFSEVQNLLENAAHDTESALYNSKYAARIQLQSINQLLQSLKSQNVQNSILSKKIIGMLGTVQYQLGTIAMDTGESSLAEQHYDECLQIIEDYINEPEVVSLSLNLFNRMGMLHVPNNISKGKMCLHRAQQIYDAAKASHVIPIHYMDLFDVSGNIFVEDAKLKFESSYMFTLFYLAQAYIPSNPLKGALYCHETLQRQYDYKQYEHIDWALNTATLSQYFIQHNGFKQARHHLCASLFMLDAYKAQLDADVAEGEEHEAKVEYFRQRYADVARCWIKYSLNLLLNSKDRLKNTENIDVTASTCTDLCQMPELEGSTEDFKQLQFKNIDLSEYEAEVTDQFLLTIVEAKKVFVFAIRWVMVAQEYLTLDTHASDYLEIGYDHSNLYDALAFFEDDTDTQCKYYKRSMDIIEKPLSSVNPTYYMSQCRQNWHHIGSLASDTLQLKMEKLENCKTKIPLHAQQKINSLVGKSVSYLSKFIDSFRNADGILPAKVPETYEKVFLEAYFLRAAVSPKYVTSDQRKIIANIRKGIADYKALVDYVKANESAMERIKDEYEVADVMIPLLQLKIEKLENAAPIPKVQIPSNSSN